MRSTSKPAFRHLTLPLGLAIVLAASSVSAQIRIKPQDNRLQNIAQQDIAQRIKLPLRTKTDELKLLKNLQLKAKPIESAKLLTTFPVTKLDYSEFVTFQRNQDGWGGCFHYAALHTMDVLNEWRAPYTPDLSFRYLEYWGTVRFNEQEDRAQIRTLAIDGVCSEASLHTNYDLSTLVGSGKDKDGDGVEDKIMDHVIFQGSTPKPTAENDAEAKRYRVKMSGDYKPTVATIKTFLCEYGPVWAAGQFHYSLNIGYGEGHVIAIVGFDDQTQTFKCLNSWGANRPADGFFNLAYGDVDRVWNTQDSAGNAVSENEVWSLRYIENAATDRSTGPEAYSARVSIRTNKRNSLTVSVGVAGQQPLVAWDRPNRVNLNDWGGDLILDIPLPDYAASHWPPKPGANPWFVEIKDCDADGVSARVLEFTLAKRVQHPHCKSIGAVQTEKYQLAQLPTIPDQGSTIAYVPGPPQQTFPAVPNKPALKVTPGLKIKPGIQQQEDLKSRLQLKQEPKIRDGIRVPQIKPQPGQLTPGNRIGDVKPAFGLDVELSSNNPSVQFGQNFVLTAKLVSGGQPSNLAGREVTFYWTHPAKFGYRNKPEEFTVIGKGVTAADGTASLSQKSAFSSRSFAAAIVEADGSILASSHKLTIGQIVK